MTTPYKATFETFGAGKDERIKAVYPHADERAVTFVVDVDTADELGQLLSGLPGFSLASWSSHPVESVDRVIKVLTEAEQTLTAQA